MKIGARPFKRDICFELAFEAKYDWRERQWRMGR